MSSSPRSRPQALWQHRDFLLLWGGQTVSETACWPGGSARLSWLSMTVFSLPGLLILAARPGAWALLFAAGWMSWTFSATICSVALLTYRQMTCPPALLAQVNACARWVTWGTLPLGSVAGGVLASAIGVPATLWVAVTGGCLAGLWLFFSPLRGLRDIPASGPSASPALP